MTSTFVLRDAAVLDESGSFADRLDVVVSEGHVTAVGRSLAAPEGAEEHDFAGLWLMPGIFDCHVHISWSTMAEIDVLRTPLTQQVLATAANLRRTLEAGVTFVRDAGGADPGMRNAVARGDVDGPHMHVSLNLLCETGGHCDCFLESLGVEWSRMPEWPGRPPALVDSPDDMRRAVRQLLRAGVDWIKVCSTGGMRQGEGDSAQLTEEEIHVAVVEAARRGKWVMSHAFGGAGLDNAVRAGVRSVEHGLFLTERQASEMADAGCWLIPTLTMSHEVVRWAEQAPPGAMPARSLEQALALKQVIGKQVELAKAAGVPMAIGTDMLSRDHHGRNLEELPYMRQAGLTVEETLLAATIRGAELCGVADRHGRIAPGYVFDAIVLDQDPGDLSLFFERGAVRGVFKAGAAVVPHERLGGVVVDVRQRAEAGAAVADGGQTAVVAGTPPYGASEAGR